jgi:hypothetical protein
MNFKTTTIHPPSKKEIRVLRLLILMGLVSIVFFSEHDVPKKSNQLFSPLYFADDYDAILLL